MKVAYETATRSKPAWGYVRTLTQQEELPLLSDHLLRLDPAWTDVVADGGNLRYRFISPPSVQDD